MNDRLRLRLICVTFLLVRWVGDATLAAEPNIVFFLADDQRFNLMGCAGHPVIRTPTMDSLAEEGVRFKNAFVTTAICAASRASYFTGLHERTHRFTFGTPPIATEFLQDSYPTLLRKAGYETMFVGKFGVKVGQGQTQEMFDHFIPLNRNPYFKPQPDGTERHISQIAADHAIEFLGNRNDNKPFCISVSFNAPHAEDSDKLNHYPYPKAVGHLYEGMTMPLPYLSEPAVFDSQPRFLRESMNRDRWYWRWDTPEKYQKNIRNYYRMISGIDHAMGRVLAEITRLGLEDNTVIIFAGDNGYYAGSRGFAGKWSHYEESLRVPLIIKDPRLNAERKGSVATETVLNIDVTATLVDLGGLDTPDRYSGVSLLGLTRGEARPNWRTDFFCEHLFENRSIPKWEGVRDNRWVYARYFEQDPTFEFLHDLHEDPNQLKNLVDDERHSQQLAKMRTRCDALRDSYGGVFEPHSSQK